MRSFIANLIAKLSKFSVEKLRLGKGSALPGRVALAIDPDFIKNYNNHFRNGDYNFFISGTNGKTTSSGILASILNVATNKEIVNNAFGANLYYGIASEIVNRSGFDAKLSSNDFVFEVDEAAFRQVAKDIKPKAVVLTNIFRDQLDRFGEINATQKLILEGLEAIKEDGVKVFLNICDEKIAEFESLLDASFEIYFYKVDNVDIAFKEGVSSRDLSSKDIFTASLLERKVAGSLIRLSFKKESIDCFLPIAGDFNVYNACAAAAAAYHSGVSLEDIKTGIEVYKSAFGRGEKIIYDNKELNVFLIKNPAGCTEVINFVSQFENSKVVIAINDNYADGRDVSWLWDASFENFVSKGLDFICTGSRAYDMALRLKYAGIDNSKISIHEDIIPAIKDFAVKSRKDENLFVLPTYTALLEINSSSLRS
jgi:lipid II isoglutaminyl synthase (glutamine-hydrolysing)